MPRLLFRPGRLPDVRELEQKGDADRLISLLSNSDFNVQTQAAAALERLKGDLVTETLINALDTPDRKMRIGIVEILSNLHDPGAVPALLNLLSDDESNEVRWASAIALGEIGDPAAQAGLVTALSEPDKYVRYGAALSLEKNGWTPSDPEGRVYFLAAAQRWADIPGPDAVPVEPLIHHLKDSDPTVRANAVKILGELHDPAARAACDLVLRDITSTVRKEALRAFPKCNIPLMHLPRGISKRRRQRSAFAAMVLNFFCLGLGYNYLGRWWGFLVFQVNVTAILTMSLFVPSYVAYLTSWAISAPFALHTYHYVRGKPDL
ncbi:MAG: HEAT repeat protein [Euryarchaeota archaeon ADurb.BinA087]|nr:MAG: HEAT repeat protein [Euryarchaeota archaeon ADurb.BinA087]HNQ25755.1 HEAT repeat domain-containing protein [Methanoregulaceae archaeon]HPX73610.1 HEAT repeat domain-containing protein [Methanoregulaceae archaeon]HQA79379.1 HEAT repeat domain-containing protein [Methanoregulaceae archaeon]